MSETYLYDVFISYAHEDKAYARRLADKLSALDFFTWMADPEVGDEELLTERIEEALDNSAACLLLFGPSGKSPWRNESILWAMDERAEQSDGGFRLIPVSLLGGSVLPPPSLRRVKSLRRLERPGAFVKFEKTLDEDEATKKLITMIRGVDPDEPSLWEQEEFRLFVNLRARNASNVSWNKLAVEARSAFNETCGQDTGTRTASEVSAELTFLTLLDDETLCASLGRYAFRRQVSDSLEGEAQATDTSSPFPPGNVAGLDCTEEVRPPAEPTSVRLSAVGADEQSARPHGSSTCFEEHRQSLDRLLVEVMACRKSPDELLRHPEFRRRGRLMCQALCYGFEPHQVEAEDLYRDVSYKIWQRTSSIPRPRGIGATDGFFEWFRQVARNTLHRTLRENKERMARGDMASPDEETACEVNGNSPGRYVWAVVAPNGSTVVPRNEPCSVPKWPHHASSSTKIGHKLPLKTFPHELEGFLRREVPRTWEGLDELTRRFLVTLGTRLESIVQIFPQTPVPLVIGFENLALGPLGENFGQICERSSQLEPGVLRLLVTLAALKTNALLRDIVAQDGKGGVESLLFTINLGPEMLDCNSLRRFLNTYRRYWDKNVIFEVDERTSRNYLRKLKELQVDLKLRFCADDFNNWDPQAKREFKDRVEMCKIDYKTFRGVMNLCGYDPQEAVRLIMAHRIADKLLVVEGVWDESYIEFLREHWPSNRYGRLYGQGRLTELGQPLSARLSDLRDFGLHGGHFLTEHDADNIRPASSL